MKRGPYISLDGDEVFIPASESTYNQARAEAASIAEEMNGPWERTRFVDKGNYGLHDHDDWEDCISPACDEPAY